MTTWAGLTVFSFWILFLHDAKISGQEAYFNFLNDFFNYINNDKEFINYLVNILFFNCILNLTEKIYFNKCCNRRQYLTFKL